MEAHSAERFALYGFEFDIPNDWRVEFNPKSSRKKGDMVFQSERSNRLFVSWGPLEEAKKRFKTLEEHRDWNIEQVRKSPNLKELNASEMMEYEINGHRALSAHVTATLKRGIGGRSIVIEDMWSVRFYCPNIARYYVIYSQLKDPAEYEDYGSLFNSIARTFHCHPS
ncbi:MAG: hypothetical protein ACYC7D_14415 [Nitrososphaerales archaeon]